MEPLGSRGTEGLLCPAHAQPLPYRSALSKWVPHTTARVTSVGTERATERDCMQLIDLCTLLTEDVLGPHGRLGVGCSE